MNIALLFDTYVDAVLNLIRKDVVTDKAFFKHKIPNAKLLVQYKSEWTQLLTREADIPDVLEQLLPRRRRPDLRTERRPTPPPPLTPRCGCSGRCGGQGRSSRGPWSRGQWVLVDLLLVFRLADVGDHLVEGVRHRVHGVDWENKCGTVYVKEYTVNSCLISHHICSLVDVTILFREKANWSPEFGW